MRIIVLSYSLSSGGAEHFAVDLCNALSAENEVTLLTTDDDALKSNSFYLPEVLPSVRYANLGCRSGLSVSALLRICRFIKKNRPDVVHANTDLLQLLLPLLSYRKARYFHTLHSVADYYLVSPFLKPLFRWIYRHRVTPVTISALCSLSYRYLYGLQNDVLILNGRSRPLCSDNADSVREKLHGFRKGRPLFIHISRYAPPKNQEALFKAFEKVPEVCLTVVGRDFPSSIVQSQDPSRVLFVGEQKNIADYLAESDFFVLSSLFEGLPLSLLEAMSFGVVPVSTPAGGVCDVIRDGDNGFLADGFDVDSLAVAIRRALSCPIDKEALVNEYRQKYAMDSCAACYQRLFGENKGCGSQS